MSEQLPQNNKPEQREKTQIQSDGMSEKLNRESINKLSTQFSVALGEKFEKKGITFNIQDFKSKITKSIEQVFLNPNIPDIAKEKFRQDFMSKIELLSSVSIEDINTLKNRRIVESLGVEYLELRGKNEGEKQAFFLSKILEETIGKYIEPVADSLLAAFDGEKIRVGSIEYGKKNLDDFNTNMKTLDILYELDIAGEIRTFQAERIKKGLGDISREDLYREMGQKIVLGMNKRKAIPDVRRVSEFIRNGNLTNNSKGGRLTEATLPDGSKKDIVDIVLEYKKHIVSFQGVETESRETREVALADDAISRAKKGLGMEQLKSEFDHLKPTDIEAKMKNKSFADMVIIATQLAQLAPIVGDIGGGIDGIVSAYSGMNVDGAKLSHLERGMNTIFGVLGISVMGGWAVRAKNANKVRGLLESFSVMKKYLPEKFETFLKAGGKISEEAKAGIMKFAKMMGREFAEQIEGMMKKNGMILGFTEDAKKWNKEPPKVFVVHGIDSQSLMQQLTSYYHPDRNHHEFANSIMQEINRLKSEMKAGKNIRKELEALAQNPPGLQKTAEAKNGPIIVELKRKSEPHKPPTAQEASGHRAGDQTPEQAGQTFIDMIEKLKNNFSYENLKELASKEDIMFGEQLLHRQIFIDISRLAKSDISKAMQEYTAYCSGSKAYIFKKYGSPEKIDEAIDLLKYWAYNHEFKTEGDIIFKRNQEAYRKVGKKTETVASQGSESGFFGQAKDKPKVDRTELFMGSIKKLPKNELAQDLLRDVSFNPQTLIEIDGFKGIFSQVVQSGTRFQVVAIVEHEGKIEARIFYKSNSDGIWKATSGRRDIEEGGISKLESVKDSHYVATAKLDPLLETHLTQLTKQQAGKFEAKNYLGYFEGNAENGTKYGRLHKEAKEEITPFGSNTMKKSGIMDERFQPGDWKREGVTGNELLQKFQNQQYPPGFLPDFSKGFINKLKTNSTFTGPTTVFVFEGILEGRKVEWHMAVSNLEKKVWIDGIIPSGSGVSSLGTSKEFINSGFLTSKPFEYADQLPEDITKGKKLITLEGQAGYPYCDITNELKNIKPVKDFIIWLNENGVKA